MQPNLSKITTNREENKAKTQVFRFVFPRCSLIYLKLPQIERKSKFFSIFAKIMGRLLSIDYGRKRSGIAVTDVLGIVANGLATVRSHLLVDFLRDYCSREPVDAIIVGLPRQMNGEESESMKYIRPFLKRLGEALPDVPVEMFDERFTSVLAHRAMIDGGMKKSDRRNRGEVDKISATIILNDYLASNPARRTK